MGNNEVKPDATFLTQKDIETIQLRESFSHDQVIECYRIFMKENPGGWIDRKKFIEKNHQLYPNSRGDAFLKAAFDVFDLNKSGTLDFYEFLMALEVVSSADLTSKLKLGFKIYDTDKNGMIKKKEFRRLLRAAYKLNGTRCAEPVKKRAKSIFKKIDENGDGAISEEEFINGLMSNSDLMHELLPMKSV